LKEKELILKLALEILEKLNEEYQEAKKKKEELEKEVEIC
jgi:hypothetical protein